MSISVVRRAPPAPRPALDLERASKSPSGIIRVSAVVVHENRVIAAIAEQRAAKLSDLRRCLHPAGRLRIELTERLEPLILVDCEQCGAHGRCHLVSAGLRLVLPPCLERFAIVTHASASLSAL